MEEMDMNKATVDVLTVNAKEIYNDALKPATKESGQALQAVVGLFNNVVLYPIKKANITFKYKLEQFEQDLKKKTEKIPSEKLIEPPLTVSGPTLEALKYTFDTKELREMYLNLLTASMNIDTVKLTHPAYIELIKAMTPLDAIAFQKASKLGQIPCSRVTIGFDNKVYINALPKIFAPDLLDKEDPFLLSASIENLCRLGLLTHINLGIVGYDYAPFKNHAFIKQQFETVKPINTEVDLKIKTTEEVLMVSDFGKNFADACLSDTEWGTK